MTKESKIVGTHITEKTPRHFVHIILWSRMGPNMPKIPIFDQKCPFWAKFVRFWPKILNFMGVSESFGTHITENHLDNLFTLFFGRALDQMGQKYVLSQKKHPKFLKRVIFIWKRVQLFPVVARTWLK